MKFYLLLLATLVTLQSNSARAESEFFLCTFQEPSGSTHYDFSSRKLEIKIDGERPQTIENVNLIINSEGTFNLFAEEFLIQSVKLDRKGKDGASERIYPYSGKYFRPGNGLIQDGGCESVVLKYVQPEG